MAGFGLAGIGAFLSGGDVAGATADTLGGDDAVFGTKPLVAPFTPVDLAAEQARAVGGNITNMAEIDRLLESILPGYREMLTQGSKNTLSMLHGEVPGDLQDKVRRNSAYQSLIGGYSGSGMSKALTARDFGLTSLDMMREGTNTAQLWSKMATGTVAPFMVNTAQQAEVTAANNLGLQNQLQYQFNVNAAPDPAAAAKYAINSAIGMKMLDFGIAAGTKAMSGGSGPQQNPQQNMQYSDTGWSSGSGGGGWWNGG